MRLYHYATWAGEAIQKSGVILPNINYANWVKHTLLTRWPDLVFLTQNEYWEPSIQSVNKQGLWEKCGSYPETYAALGIPCWKFEVNLNTLVLGMVDRLSEEYPRWDFMLQDAEKMGSHTEDWRVTSQDCYVINTWKWENDEWMIPTNE